MWCTTPEISWHNRDPVLSVDIQVGIHETNKGKFFWRIATGGTDSHVLIWHLTTNEVGGTTVECVTDLKRHQRAVNVVRFSPSGRILASADDESTIILWEQKEECEFLITSDESKDKEQWVSWKVLRGHLEDVYDISWSPSSTMLVSGSVDNTAILWDIRKGRSIAILSDHKGFVQGVSWDPSNEYISTISTDRVCRLINLNTKKTVQKVYKAKLPTPTDHSLKDKTVRLFYDDTFKSFFRRLTFSIDGLLIIVPSGIIEPSDTTKKILNATLVFSRHNLKEPVMLLPSIDECTIAVKCCPIYFKLRKDGPSPMIALPYRMIFAVATEHSIIIYDTQQISPVAVISNIHYTRLTDISWSSDGKILIASSTDGYCSIVHFQKGELGEECNLQTEIPTTKDDLKHTQTSSSGNKNVTEKSLPTVDVDNSAMDIDIANNKPVKAVDIHLDNLTKKESDKTEVITKQEPKLNETDVEETEDITLVYSEDTTNEGTKTKTKTTPKKTEIPPTLTNKTPRRVQLITISSPKRLKKNDAKSGM